MAANDPRIDEYISKAAPFAKPIMEHLRRIVHEACPNVEETWKWSFPHFDYKGMMCSMAAFRQHCAFTFWKASIMNDPHGIINPVGKTAMGHLGQIRSLADLPPDEQLKAYIREAMRLNDEGINLPAKKKAEPKELQVPDWFHAALKQNLAAFKTFEGFSYTNKKDYLEWILDAKTEATREKRMAQAVEWMSEGKIRNWKYQK